MNTADKVKAAVYHYFSETGNRPSVAEISSELDIPNREVEAAYRQLARERLLVLEADGISIRMAPPFSGIPTQHEVWSRGRRYFANCAWDALGITAALGEFSTVHSRCEQSGEPLDLEVGLEGPDSCSWLFHSLVPASRWWDDINCT